MTVLHSPSCTAPLTSRRAERKQHRPGRKLLLPLLAMLLPLLGCRPMTVSLARRMMAPISTAAAPFAPTPTPTPTPDPNATPRPALILVVDYGCSACHTIPPITNEDRFVGPNLSNIGIEAASRLPDMSAEEYIRQSIAEPDVYLAARDATGVPAPAGIMPQNYAEQINPQELDALVAFLLTLKRQYPTQETGAPFVVPLTSGEPPEIHQSIQSRSDASLHDSSSPIQWS